MEYATPAPKRPPLPAPRNSKAMPLREQNGANHAYPRTRLTFDSLADVLLRTFDVTPFMWKKTIDWASQILLFYQVDARGAVPRISKCVRVHCEGYLNRNPLHGHRLVPSIFLGEQPVSSSYLKEIIGRDHILSISDLMKLLENLAATSETENFGPDEDTRENQSKEVPYKPLPLSDSLSYEARATDIDEFQMFETNDMFDEAEQMPAAEATDGDLNPADEDFELELGQAPRKSAKRKRASRATRTAVAHQRAIEPVSFPSTSTDPQTTSADEETPELEGVMTDAVPPRIETLLFSPTTGRLEKFTRSTEQMRLLDNIMRSLSTRGAHKMELFPGSRQYLPLQPFTQFKALMFNRTPLGACVELCLLVLGSSEAALTLFSGDHFGLKTALGQDTLNKLLAFINAYHPKVVNNECLPVYDSQLTKAFSRKLRLLRIAAAAAPGTTVNDVDDDYLVDMTEVQKGTEVVE